MSDHAEQQGPPDENQPGKNPEPTGAPHHAAEQSDPASEVASTGSRVRRNRTQVGIVAAIALPAIVAVVLVTSSGGAGPSHQPAGSQATTAAQRIDALLAGIPQSGNALGSPTAPVTLQYFGDLECPTSREFTLGALPFVIRKWVRAGKLRIEYRSLETATPEPAVFNTQQVAALAAGMQHKLWYYLELFYHQQGREDSGYVTEEYLQGLARQVPGMNMSLWAEDRKDPQLANQVAEDGQAAKRAEFRSTPSFLIGRTGGGQPTKLLAFSVIEPAAFNVAIEKLLAEGAAQPQPRSSLNASSRLGSRVAAAYKRGGLAGDRGEHATC